MLSGGGWHSVATYRWLKGGSSVARFLERLPAPDSIQFTYGSTGPLIRLCGAISTQRRHHLSLHGKYWSDPMTTMMMMMRMRMRMTIIIITFHTLRANMSPAIRIGRLPSPSALIREMIRIASIPSHLSRPTSTPSPGSARRCFDSPLCWYSKEEAQGGGGRPGGGGFHKRVKTGHSELIRRQSSVSKITARAPHRGVSFKPSQTLNQG